MLLTEVIGLSWAKAHAEAERMEHAISPEVEALLMKRFAGHKACPHGVPLRGGFAQLRKEGAVLLSELQLHDSAETTLLTLNSRHSTLTQLSPLLPPLSKSTTMTPLDAQPAVRFRELLYLYLKPFFLAG